MTTPLLSSDATAVTVRFEGGFWTAPLACDHPNTYESKAAANSRYYYDNNNGALRYFTEEEGADSIII